MLNIKDQYGKDIEDLEPDSFAKKIIVPTDFSIGSENACYYAIHLAQKMGAEIKILHVYENPVGEIHVKETATLESFSAKLFIEMEKKANDKIIELLQRIKDYMRIHDIRDVKVHSSTIMGNVVARIKGVCNLYQPDLLVLGTIGKRETSDSILTGVSKAIIRDLGIPVFAIPGPIKFQDIEKMNILYATDFNEKDHTSLDALLKILAQFEKRINCIHIDTERNPVKVERMDELNKFLNKEYDQHEIYCSIIEDDNVYHGMNKFAERNKINLLSFTTQKQGIFKKLFRPNLFKKILQEANLPILIFPS
jgi:nucleotide-binding universal stress UspA family protein